VGKEGGREEKGRREGLVVGEEEEGREEVVSRRWTSARTLAHKALFA